MKTARIFSRAVTIPVLVVAAPLVLAAVIVYTLPYFLVHWICEALTGRSCARL